MIEPQFVEARNFTKEGVAVVGNGEKYALIDLQGNLLTEYIFDEVCDSSSSTDIFGEYGIGIVEINDKYAFIDTKGTIVKEYPESWYISGFDENGLSALGDSDVRKDGVNNIDLEGNVVIPIEYDDVN